MFKTFAALSSVLLISLASQAQENNAERASIPDTVASKIAAPIVEHPQFFWQPQAGENAVIPQTSFTSTRSGDPNAYFTDNRATTLGAEYQRGLSEQVAMAIDINYTTSQSLNIIGGGSTGGSGGSSDGFQDFLLTFKGYTGGNRVRLYYGLALDLSLQTAMASTADGISLKTNNYSGGQAAIPSLGLAWILNRKSTAGVYANYRYQDQRSFQFTDQNSVMNNFTMTGGDVAKGGFFSELSGKTWKFGLNWGVENDEAAVATSGVSSSSALSTLLTNQTLNHFSGVINAYSSINAGKSVALVPQITYTTEIDQIFNSASDFDVTLAARMVF